MRERKSHQLVLHRKEPHGTLSCITTASKHLQRNRYTTYKFCLRHTSQCLISPTFFVLGQKFFYVLLYLNSLSSFLQPYFFSLIKIRRQGLLDTTMIVVQPLTFLNTQHLKYYRGCINRCKCKCLKLEELTKSGCLRRNNE